MATQLDTTSAQVPALSPEADRFALRQRQARMFAMSPLVPDHLRRGTPEQAMANCYIALTLAEAMGEVPLIVMQNIHVVNGKAGFAAQYMIARANSSGIFKGRIDWEIDRSDANNLSVTAFATLKDTDQRVEVTCDMKMAKAEKWTNNAKYSTMPEVMLRYRSAAFLVRFYAPDVMLGYQTIEEVVDVGAAFAPAASTLTATMITDQARLGAEVVDQEAQADDTARPEDFPPNDGTLEPGNPAAAEGPSDEQRGETNTDSPADDIIARVESAAIIGDVLGIEQSYQSGGRDMFDTADQDRIEQAFADAKARLKGGK
jgi:hypothetical protein